jgi:hypothetical protein
MIAARLTPGAISVSNSNHLLTIVGSTLMRPVRFPPGWGRPATKPSPTGSASPTNTIGMVRLCRWTAAVVGVEFTRDHGGLQIDQLFREHPRPVNTCAGPTNVCIRRLRPSVQPNSESACVNPEKRTVASGSPSSDTSARRCGACARAASPAPQAATQPHRRAA